MSSEAANRVEVVALGDSAAETLVWRLRGELRVSVVVKASFAFEPDGPMRAIEPDEICRAEVHHGRNPSRTVRLTSDLAPYLPHADVVLTGHACAPDGETALGMSVRLAVFREGALLDKSINVLCDSSGDVDEPFERMPLVYERAYGGIGFAENPFGVGVGEPTPGRTLNLMDPASPERVACFAPIARAWPLRKRMLGAVDRRVLEGPLGEIPDGFNFAYFQAAPADQQIAHLHGNEWVVLEGMHPVHAQICSALPSAMGRARVFGLGAPGTGRTLALVADTLRIDADTLACSVVWRGSFPVPDAAALAALTIFAGVESTGRPIEWPAPPEPRPRPAPVTAVSSGATAAAPVALGATIASAPAAPAPLPVAPAPRGGERWVSTVELPPEVEGLAAAAPVVPFRDGPVNLPPPEPIAPHSHEDLFSTTTILSSRGDGPPSLPFQGRAPRRREPAAPPAPIVAPRAPAAAPLPARALPSRATEAAPATMRFPEAARAPTSQRARTVEGIELVNDTPLALGTLRWDTSPSRDCLTVFAKATCDLVAGGPAALRPKAEAPSADRSAPGPRGPVRVYPSDFALFKVRADVMLVGRAHAPPGGATAMQVRFHFGDDGRGFDRTLLVFGDRRWEKAGALAKPSAPATFLQMPLGPDFAFGGPGLANRAGLGRATATQRGAVMLPNLEDPAERLRTPKQTPQPASFAPVSWPIGPGAARDAAARPGPGATSAPRPDGAARSLPERFDWTRFQAAPPPQQIGFLRGDEPFEIEGIHPQHPLFAGALPGLAVRCLAERPSGREELAMRLDTALFDLDEKTLTLVWRGLLPVTDERAPDVRSLRLVTVPVADAGDPFPD